MRIYSDLRSSARGETTVLALAETAVSVALYVGVAYWFDTARHILVGAVLAPLWLLRTERSVRLGLWYYTKCYKYDASGGAVDVPVFMKGLSQENVWSWLVLTVVYWAGVFYFAPALPCVVVVAGSVLFYLACFGKVPQSCAIRMVATVVCVCRRPIVHLYAVPVNWKRLVLATDTGALPEWLPGCERYAMIRGVPVFTVRASNVFRTPLRDYWGIWSCFVMYIYVAVAFYIFPLLLRLGVKGVAILYAPLLFVIKCDPFPVRISLTDRLYELRAVRQNFLAHVYAWFVVASFAVNITCQRVVAAVHDELAAAAFFGGLVKVTVASLYFPITIKGWQLANTVSAIIFLYLHWTYAPQAEYRLGKHIWTPRQVRTFLNRAETIRLVLAVYSTLCTVALLAEYLRTHRFPDIDIWIFPRVL